MNSETGNNEEMSVLIPQIDELFPIEEEGKWGFINSKWQTVIPPTYEDIEPFHEGMAAALKDDKWGYIDLKGNIVLDFMYVKAGSFTDGQAWVRTSTGYSLINQRGDLKQSYSNEMIDEILMYSSGMYAFKKNRKIGYLKKSGDIAIEAKYDEASPFYEDIAMVSQNGTAFYINSEGQEILANKEYSPMGAFSEGLSLVRFGDNKFAYINKFGEIVIQPSNRMGSSFSEGTTVYLDTVKMKHGYMDRSGKEIIPPKYEVALPFKEGLAYVKNGSRAELIDSEGNTRYSLPKDAVADVESYFLYRDFYVINVDGDDKIVKRKTGEIRE
ncbi:WG repeat-containing protein [Paenibacillus oenotherae]|uniref:WG repeat-containing protein n=1 Tax=Paenibacillus oenotherae TaxID=1435645 RepID=A0ABS7D4Z4_9BACL|nr:WG repeat-containing protein [Paenibacillus oenotherae]MBW7474561.1 WG repeat-containing protein [Paenibacillus oenotherae]